MRALYVCYFGLREPLVQTQVLPYLRELVSGGARMSLLTFEPELKKRWDAKSIDDWRQRLRSDGIEWHMLAYHKRPSLPATLYDVLAGALRAARIARRERIDIVHGRSHVGAAIGALVKKLTGARLIFDIRGFLAEEYVDSGNWPANGFLFRLTKAAERWLFHAADGFVVLTEAAKETLFPKGTGGRAIEVIPCCVGEEHFTSDRVELGLTDRLVFAYVGTLGGSYLTRETVALLATARQADRRVFALVLTRTAAIADELEQAGFSHDDYCVMQVAPEDVPRYLRAADVGLVIMRPSEARRAQSPTKFAEYLAAGVPVIATAGVGDLDAHIEEGHVGVLLRSHDRAAFSDAFRAIEELRRDPQLGDRCLDLARRRYDLHSVGGPRYRRLYDAVLHRRIRVLALATYPVQAASSRVRVVQFMEPLAQRGIDVTFAPFLSASLFAALYAQKMVIPRLPRIAFRALRRIADALRAARADIVLVQREAMLFGPPLIEWIAARLLRRRMILDLDDATYVRYVSPVYGRLATMLKWPSKTDRLIRWSSVVTCGNENIAAYVRSLGAEATVVPSIVDTRVFRPQATKNDVPVIGWIGTHSTYPFFERLIPIFEQLAREQRFRVTVVGAGREARVRGVEVDSRAWRLERDADDFRSLDIGVYPIADDARSAGKSGLKAVQYMSSGVPFVMSPVGVCATMGIAGQTHFAAVTDEEWLDALRRLVTDGTLRKRMGAAGRAFAEKHYSIDEQADVLASVMRKLATR